MVKKITIRKKPKKRIILKKRSQPKRIKFHGKTRFVKRKSTKA